MPHQPITDRSISKFAVPTAGRVTYLDPSVRGFGLRVSANGARSWVVRYRRGRLTRRVTLGSYPKLSLADARAKAKETLGRVALGEDPAADRRTERGAPTFDDLANEYLERHARPKKRSAHEDARILAKYVPNRWRKVPAHTVTRRDVRDVLDDIAKRSPIMANRVLACWRKVFNFAIKRDLVAANPCAMLDRPAVEKQRERVLSADELRRLWRALEAGGASGDALRLMLFTAQRGGEVMTLAWEDVDFDVAWWTIPAQKSKNKLAHRVPLSPAAIALLVARRPNDASRGLVFPVATGRIENRALDRVRRATGEPCGECRVCVGAKRFRPAAEPAFCVAPRNAIDFVPHDLRRTVATFMTSELGVSRLVVSKLLNHVETGVTRVYDRASYDREKRQALDAWAVRLDQIVSRQATAAKVVPLRA